MWTEFWCFGHMWDMRKVTDTSCATVRKIVK